ncbi:MAG: ORF6N domain-containing protein [Bacteroidales bacterium]|jgi:hypothetical protein|nr:ORF6N domain-containing protein [Bacteroidales bacterium]
MDHLPVLKEENIVDQIYLVRGVRVMLDADLADLYKVETRVLKQAVRRNIKRFPEDFMFELTSDETISLRSQSVTLKRGQHSKYPPFAFTEQGVAMLAGILNSDYAIEVNIIIMRTFVQMRALMLTYKDLADKINEMEANYDKKFAIIFNALKQLIGGDNRKVIEGYRKKK